MSCYLGWFFRVIGWKIKIKCNCSNDFIRGVCKHVTYTNIVTGQVSRESQMGLTVRVSIQ